MNVPSLQFLGLAAAAALLFQVSSARVWRQAVMLLVNLVFFASFFRDSVVAYLPFVGFLALGYLALYRTQNRVVGWSLVGAIVLTFFWLKKYTFVPTPMLLSFPYVTIGLSYVFFRVLHLAIDAQEATLPERPGLVSYINYTLNFTSLVSGPIQRYDQYAPMERNPVRLGVIGIGQSLERICVGSFKVFVLSAALAGLQSRLIDGLTVDQNFSQRVGAGVAVIAIYPIYLYFNFSGYTDFVIGTARWFGLILPENFNRPFQVENFMTFWSHWHMTLSGWLKTYVYQPLMMRLMERLPDAKYAPALSVFALFVTFFLVGAWHGQTSTFLFFGVLQGLGVSLNQLYQIGMTKRLGRKQFRSLSGRPVYRACARGLTFTWFSFTLLWFWSDWTQMEKLQGILGGPATILALVVLFAISTILLAAWKVIFNTALALRVARQPIFLSRYSRVMWSTALAFVTVTVIMLMNTPAPTVVYKNF
jgi:D-alanyl-lipoteichoic acid acyltransferase DltB (MBOAT superfamily)